MDIRKIIREGIESFLSENEGNVIGADIINRIVDLPGTRKEVDWSHPRVSYSISDLTDGDAMLSIFDKESLNKYIQEFQAKFGEQPSFKISGRNIEVLNPNFNEWKSQVQSNRSDALKQFGTTD